MKAAPKYLNIKFSFTLPCKFPLSNKWSTAPWGIPTVINPNVKSIPLEVEEGIQRFSDSLLSIFRRELDSGYLVAIHNNTNNNFSVRSYVNSKNVIATHVNSDEDIDNFYIVNTL